MRFIRPAARFLIRHWMVVLAVLANLAIAGPVQAGWRTSACAEPETGDTVSCCEYCLFFCGCDMVVEEE